MNVKLLALVFAVSISVLLSTQVHSQAPAPKREATATDSSKKGQMGAANNQSLGRAQYSAIQMRSAVKLFAVGFNATTGYKNKLERTPLDVFPPQYRFLSFPPKGPAGDAFTYFKVEASFATTKDVATLEIVDADGVHKVEVFHDTKDASRAKDGAFPMFK